MIKIIILLTVILMPCLLAFSESNSVLPNIIGLAYMFLLAYLSSTMRGKKFCRKVYRNLARTNDDIFAKE